MDDLIGEFISETSESLAVLDSELVKLDQNPNDREILATIFRLVHTIKGTCGFLGLARLESVAKAVESVLAKIERGEIAVSQSASFAVLEALAAIKNIMEHLAEHGEEPAGDDRALIEHLQGLTSGQPQPAKAAPKPEKRQRLPEPVFPEPEQDLDLSPLMMTHPPIIPAASSLPVPMTETISTQAKQEAIRQGLKTEMPEKAPMRWLLDKLAWALSELVTARNQLKVLARQLQDDRLAAPIARIGKVTGELTEIVQSSPEKPSTPINVMTVLLLETGGFSVALPQRYVTDVVNLAIGGDFRVQTVHNTEVLVLGRRVIPLVKLAALLGITNEHKESQVAVVKVGEAEYGLISASAGEEEEIVLSDMPRLFKKLDLYRGVSLADGDKPLLVLDPVGLARAIGYRQVKDQPPAHAKPRSAEPSRMAGFLLFRAGDGAPKALLLDDVARVAEVIPEEDSDLHIALLPGMHLPRKGGCEVIVLATKGRRPIAIAVDQIMDVVHAPLTVKANGNDPAYLGTVSIRGRATELVDARRFTAHETREAA